MGHPCITILLSLQQETLFWPRHQLMLLWTEAGFRELLLQEVAHIRGTGWLCRVVSLCPMTRIPVSNLFLDFVAETEAD